MTATQLKQWRGSRSQSAVAALIGCHVNSIANWEAGKSAIPKYIVLAILAVDAGLGA